MFTPFLTVLATVTLLLVISAFIEIHRVTTITANQETVVYYISARPSDPNRFHPTTLPPLPHLPSNNRQRNARPQPLDTTFLSDDFLKKHGFTHRNQ
jgi:hypothetical protein